MLIKTQLVVCVNDLSDKQHYTRRLTLQQPETTDKTGFIGQRCSVFHVFYVYHLTSKASKFTKVKLFMLAPLLLGCLSHAGEMRTVGHFDL